MTRITKEWLRRRIEDEPDACEVEAGAPEMSPLGAIERYALRMMHDGGNSFDRANAQAIIDICRAQPSDPTRSLANITSAMWSEAEKESDQLRDALRLILPLAKGYIAANDVGSNREHIAHAEALLETGARTGQCDCCGADNVDLSFSVSYGIETWSCAEGCDTKPAKAHNTKHEEWSALADDPEAKAIVENWLSGFGEPPLQLSQLQKDWLVSGIASALQGRQTEARGAHGRSTDHIEQVGPVNELRVVFDGPPGHHAGRFVEVETPDGKSVCAGTWHERPDGLWELRIRTKGWIAPARAALAKAPTTPPDRSAP